MDWLNKIGKAAAEHGPGLMKLAQQNVGSSNAGSSGSKADDEFSANAAKAVPATVHMFSGCRDDQTSADVYDVASFGLPQDCGPAGAGGACTHSLLKFAYSKGSESFTYKELLIGMRGILKEGRYSQVPQVCSSKQLNLDTNFSLSSAPERPGKRAVLIGINYEGQEGALRGCHNDVDSMLKYLKHTGFAGPSCQVRILRDNGKDEAPTYENILLALEWLAEGATAGDSLFLHYSGHGSRMKDDNGEEADGYDETLVPLDYNTAGQMRDDVVHKALVMRLPKDVMLTAVMDCCHSGTILDLPYELKVDSNTFEQLLSGQLGQLLENQGFFGAAVRSAIQWVADNPQQALSAANTAFKMARGLKLF